MWTLNYWKQTVELALRGGAQMVIVAWAVGDGVLNAFTVDWLDAGGFFLGGVAISVLSSLVAGQIGNRNSPVAVKSELTPQE